MDCYFLQPSEVFLQYCLICRNSSFFRSFLIFWFLIRLSCLCEFGFWNYLVKISASISYANSKRIRTDFTRSVFRPTRTTINLPEQVPAAGAGNLKSNLLFDSAVLTTLNEISYHKIELTVHNNRPKFATCLLQNASTPN